MHFDDSLFETSSPSSVAKETRDEQPPYSAKIRDHEWFVCEDGSCYETPLEECTLLKYKADLFYRKKQFSEAGDHYTKMLAILPPTHSLLKREVRDSLARCYLQTGKFQCALAMALLLVSPPHEKDCSSWQLLARCHCALGQHDSEIIALQTAVTLQRYHPPLWIELAEVYSHYKGHLHESLLPSPAAPPSSHTTPPLSSNSSTSPHEIGSTHNQDITNASSSQGKASSFQGKASSSQGNTNASSSQQLSENLHVIVSNTVALLRPYFGLGGLAAAGARGEEEIVAERMVSKRDRDTGEETDARMKNSSDDVIMEGGGATGCLDTAPVANATVACLTVRTAELCLHEGTGGSKEGSYSLDSILSSCCHDTGNLTLEDRIGGVKGQNSLSKSLFSYLLTRQMSSKELVRHLQLLSGEKAAMVLGNFYEMAACSCLLWARQLLLYSVQCSHSFAESAQQTKLGAVEQQLKHYHGNMIHFLCQHFKQTTVFDDTS